MFFGVIGGDLRFLYLTKYLHSIGHDAAFYSPDGKAQLPEEFSHIPLMNVKECVHHSDALILPLPASRGKGEINCPLVEKNVSAGELFSLIPRNTPVFVGKADKCITVAARDAAVELRDYYLKESLLTQNAVYTAEGAISIMISSLPRAICRSAVAIFGYGRIASLLTRRLIPMGATVRVIARSDTKRACALADGAIPFPPEKTNEALSGVICAVNTVPAPILTPENLAYLAPAPLIELADSPCADEGAAGRAGVRLIPAPALPGKFAPESAGILIADTVLSMLG